MAGNILQIGTTWTQMMSTEMNSLASATGVLQSTGTNAAFDNSSAGWYGAEFELNGGWASTPAVGDTIDVYLIPLSSAGGTTYWGGSATIRNPNLYVGSFVCLVADTSAHYMGFIYPGRLPVDKFILSVINNAGVAMLSSGNVIKIKPFADQYT